MKEFDGKKLVGSYDVDSEGVPAQAVKVVGDGTLENYLVGRQPIRDFPSSNGHGRASPGTAAFPTVGTLIFKSSEPATVAELKKKLMAMAGEHGEEYRYPVDTLRSRNAPQLPYPQQASVVHEEVM